MSVITLRLNEWEEPKLFVRIKPEAAKEIAKRFEGEIIDEYPEDGTFVFGKCIPNGFYDVHWSIQNCEIEARINCWDKFGDTLPLDDLDVRLNAYLWIKSHIKPEEIAR